MMKRFLGCFALFLVLAFVFSGLTGCFEAVGSPNDVASDEGKTKSAFPPLPTTLAETTIQNVDKTSFTMNDKKGQVVLLNMWATWCGPCRSEMPALVKMQEQHSEKGFTVIGLNVDDETEEQIKGFADEMKLNYPIVWADTKMQAELVKISKFTGIPQSFLVDRGGHLRGVFKGANPSDVRQMQLLVDKVVSE